MWAAGALSIALVLALWWTTLQTVRATLEEGARTEVDTDIAGLVDIYASNGREELALRIADRVAVTPMEGNTPHYLLAADNDTRLAGDIEQWPKLDAAISQSGTIVIAGNLKGYARAVQLDRNLRLVVARTMEDSEPLLQRISLVFIIGGAVLVVLVIMLGRLAAMRLQRRIERINAAFREPAQGDALALFSKTGGDEIDELTAHSSAALMRVRDLMEAYRDTSDQLAHEIRTPLTHLDNHLIKALRDHPAEPVAQKLAEARGEIRRLVQTLKSLLDIASSKARKGDRTGLKPFDLSAMVTRICDLYSSSAEDSGHAFDWDIEPGVMLAGEEEQLSRLVTNLLDNALKYVPPGGRIDVSLSAGPVLVVKDDGPGVASKDREMVFKRFYRGDAGSTDHPGSGLGLALAQAIAERHGLRLRIDDTLAGASFRLVRA